MSGYGRPRLQLWLAVILLSGLLCGCPRDEEPDPALEDPIPPRALEVGESVQFEFPSDGYWHKSPFMAFNGQTLRFAPAGDARGLSAQAIRLQIDQTPYMMREGTEFRITMPGRIGFRVDTTAMPETTGPVQVEIKRVK